MSLKLVPADAVQDPVESVELPVVIGRGGGVQIRVDCRWASRLHCRIADIDGDPVLTDLGSRHGTIVNGALVREVVLRDGDEIWVGMKRLVVRRTDQELRREHESVTESEGQVD